jgi:hypothetical protein
MAVVEIMAFSLKPGVDADAFLASDKRVQTELVPNRAGFVRRTTARRDGSWLVVTLWASEAAAVAFDQETAGDDVRQAFEGHIEAASLRTKRFDTLD